MLLLGLSDLAVRPRSRAWRVVDEGGDRYAGCGLPPPDLHFDDDPVPHSFGKYIYSQDHTLLLFTLHIILLIQHNDNHTHRYAPHPGPANEQSHSNPMLLPILPLRKP